MSATLWRRAGPPPPPASTSLPGPHRPEPSKPLTPEMKTFIHTVGYDSATKRNRVLICTIPRANLENLTQMERTTPERTTFCVIPFMCHVQEREIHRHRNEVDDRLPGDGDWRRWRGDC